MIELAWNRLLLFLFVFNSNTHCRSIVSRTYSRMTLAVDSPRSNEDHAAVRTFPFTILRRGLLIVAYIRYYLLLIFRFLTEIVQSCDLRTYLTTVLQFVLQHGITMTRTFGS